MSHNFSSKECLSMKQNNFHKTEIYHSLQDLMMNNPRVCQEEMKISIHSFVSPIPLLFLQPKLPNETNFKKEIFWLNYIRKQENKTNTLVSINTI
jgi:hypothetical protein